MLLAIDIGNTNIVIGGIKDDQIVFEARIATDRVKTSDQYGVEIKNILSLFEVGVEDIKDCIISSVVPPVFNSVRTGVVKAIRKQPLVVGPGIKTGLNIQVDSPSQVGSDRIVIAVAALAVSTMDRVANGADMARGAGIGPVPALRVSGCLTTARRHPAARATSTPVPLAFSPAPNPSLRRPPHNPYVGAGHMRHISTRDPESRSF